MDRVDENNLLIYELNKSDISENYFHFTKTKNLNSIKNMGLIPKINFHAKHLEITKKVFFVKGLDNLLCLFDCWINVCEKYPYIPGMFSLGTKIMKYKWFPKSIINGYFKYTEYNKIHLFVAYKYFDMFLEKYILLNLQISEGIDFSFDDIDEIKNKDYCKEYLIKGGYSREYSDLESKVVDKWNLHTFSNHAIDSNKIKICYIKESCKMIDILKYTLANTTLNVEKVCPVLYKYLKKRKYV